MNSTINGSRFHHGYNPMTIFASMPETALELVRRVNAALASLGKVIAKPVGRDSGKGEYVLIDIGLDSRRYLSLDEIKRLAEELDNS